MTENRIAPLLWLALLAVAWTFYGLTGRDAWRTEEALALGAILDWLQGAQAVWSEPAPLFTFAAGVLAAMTLGGLDVQDSARLASALFSLVALGCTGLAARAYFGPGQGRSAVLALMGAMGLMLRAHALVPETALLATWALLIWGVTLGMRKTWPSVWLAALALAILGLGMRGAPDLVAGLLVLLLPLALPEWRTAHYRRMVLLSIGLGAAMILLTLAWMGWTGDLAGWMEWNRERLALPLREPWPVLADLGWFAWPLWPLGLAAVWHHHRRLRRALEVLFPLMALAVLLAVSVFPAWSREGGLLPALVPLALLAAHALEHMRRGAAQAFYWFGVLCFSFFAIVFWLYFSALEWGAPVRMAAHLHRLLPAYQAGSVEGWRIGVAAVVTLLWLVAIPLFPRARIRPILVWATGMGLTWVCVISLFRPWIETGFAYRPLILEVARHLPAGACLATDTDPAMAVMVRYHLDNPATAGCSWTLRRVDPDARMEGQEGVQVLWEGRRPRLKRERYRLEHRVQG
ncbi:MAG: hypothetical protein HZB71_01755 [Betaproteobacteria bacterium]|nr:hypothetical protein [Betaproteobacteria bacterium]